MHKLGTLYFPMIGIKIHVKVRVKPWSKDWLTAAGAYPSFCSMKQLEVFLLPLHGMLVHRRSLPCNLLGLPSNLPYSFIDLGGERDCESKVCLAQEQNTMSQASAGTRIACSGVEHTNHEATAPPIKIHD